MRLLLLPQRSAGQRPFKPDSYPYNAYALSTNMAYRLLEDPHSFIWMMTNKGIWILNGKTFEAIKIPGDEPEIINMCRYKTPV